MLVEVHSRDSFARWFVISAGVILALTGAAKMWSAVGNTELMDVVDPIIGVKFGQLMLLAGLTEIATALVCYFNKRQVFAMVLIAWLATNFVAYRLGLWWMDWHRPCNCLGNFTDALHFSPQTADNTMKVLLAYLLIGSYALLFLNWRQKPTVTDGIPMGSTVE